MEHATTMVPALGVGLWQQEGGQPLPNTVPGLTSGGGDAVTPGTTPAQGSEQAPGGVGGPGPGGAQAPVGLLSSPLMLMLLLVMVFMIFTTWSSGRKEKKRAAEMLASLKRGDRVLTAGGLIGTVHEVREDSIVLRVDDVSGAKAHFTRGSIQQVIRSAKSDSKSDSGDMAEAG